VGRVRRIHWRVSEGPTTTLTNSPRRDHHVAGSGVEPGLRKQKGTDHEQDRSCRRSHRLDYCHLILDRHGDLFTLSEASPGVQSVGWDVLGQLRVLL
jgi:hypothetical protein